MSGIDWDGLVLGPLMDTFALTDASIDPSTAGQVLFTPVKSQPGQPAFPGRCIWEVSVYDVIEENSAPMSTSIIKIGLRLKDFAVPLVQGDTATINGNVYKLDSFEYDGQGGIKWTVKAGGSDQETQYSNPAGA